MSSPGLRFLSEMVPESLNRVRVSTR
jgi:hypothetical protein